MKRMKRGEFRTTDLEFAVVLLYFRIKLKHTVREGRRTVFVFEDESTIRDLQTDYINDTLQVSPRKFLALLRQTKGLFLFN